MAAPQGNQFWRLAGDRIGRPLKLGTPAELWQSCQDYFEWVDANPLKEAKAFAYEGNITIAELPKMRAMTLTGLCLFLGVDDETWRNYRAKKEYFGVVTRAENIIRTQKFEGAAAELLNSNIIARDLGLSDKSEVAATVDVKQNPDEISRAIESKLASIAAAGAARAVSKEPDA